MGFDVKHNLSELFVQENCCCMSDLPKHIVLNSPASSSLEPLERRVYALVQSGLNRGNYKLSLREYIFDRSNGSFRQTGSIVSECWQTVAVTRSLTFEICRLLLDGYIVFLGRPSLRNTLVIRLDCRMCSRSELVQAMVASRSPVVRELVY